VERLQIQIVSAVYKPGERLPSVRDLAMVAGVNPNTMQRAYAELDRLGLTTAQRGGGGRHVTEETKMIQTIRNELAATQVRDFLSRMEELGFASKEIIVLIEEEIKEVGNDKSIG
jgi:DNA-binding transcriptional regulator YhcF (GntR family)